LDKTLPPLWTLVDEARAYGPVGLLLRLAERVIAKSTNRRACMNHVVLQDVRAGFFLMVGFAMLALICTVAALSTVMRPVRWADRRSAQF
jgi:hypothetical protein